MAVKEPVVVDLTEVDELFARLQREDETSEIERRLTQLLGGDGLTAKQEALLGDLVMGDEVPDKEPAAVRPEEEGK